MKFVMLYALRGLLECIATYAISKINSQVVSIENYRRKPHSTSYRVLLMKKQTNEVEVCFTK